MRDRSLLAIAGAAAVLISAFSGSTRRCNALVLRGSIKRRGSVKHARGGVSSLSARWIDEQVSLEVPGSTKDAYTLYADLRRQPEWSPWLKSVEHDRETGKSKWVIQSNGIRVSWNAKNTVEVEGSEVAWESTTGLNNRGRVTFEDKGEGRCLMTLTLSYNLPYVIASVLRLEAVRRFVKRTILSDLARFKKVLIRQHGAVAAAPSATPSEAAHGTAATAAVHPATAPATTTAAASVGAIVGFDHASMIAPVDGAESEETEGEIWASHAPGRRSRWRRRFRRLLRRDEGRDAAAPSAVKATEYEAS